MNIMNAYFFTRSLVTVCTNVYNISDPTTIFHDFAKIPFPAAVKESKVFCLSTSSRALQSMRRLLTIDHPQTAHGLSSASKSGNSRRRCLRLFSCAIAHASQGSPVSDGTSCVSEDPLSCHISSPPPPDVMLVANTSLSSELHCNML